jgi:hypothetical protein
VNTDEEKKQLKEFVERWKRVGPILEQIRDDEIRNADTCQAIRNLDDAFKSTQFHSRPRSSSGLVEQQKYFQQLLNDCSL